MREDLLPDCTCHTTRISADRRGIDQHKVGCARRTARVAQRAAFDREQAERQRSAELLDRYGNDDE